MQQKLGFKIKKWKVYFKKMLIPNIPERRKVNVKYLYIFDFISIKKSKIL
jgi:hypothetical protein